MTRNAQAVGLMVIAMVMITSNDALIKSASESLSVSQILLLRGVMACLFLGALIKLSGRRMFPKLTLNRANMLRAVLEVATTLCFVTGLSLLPIAIATTLVWTSPILVTLVGAVLLKEAVRVPHWLAVLVGFTGVLLITQPFGAGFSWAMVLPLLAACLVAIRDFVTRRIDPCLSSYTVTLTTLILVTVAGGVLSGFAWQPVEAWEVFKLSFAAVLLVGGFYCTIEAVRVGELSFVAPFRFSAILMALILGYFVWGDVPTLPMLAGVALIVGACVYIYRHDRVGLPKSPESTVP